MVALSPILLTSYLLATSNDGGRGKTRRSGRGSVDGPRTFRGRGDGNSGRGGEGGRGGLGRKRYNREGAKRTYSNDEDMRQKDVSPLPPLTKANSPRPSYYTCRHTYESTLMNEIHRFVEMNTDGKVIATSPYPGLVRVEVEDDILLEHYNPVYALQSMPNTVVVSAVSIKGIAKAVLAALLGGEDDTVVDAITIQQRESLRAADRGSLNIHALVPGMCKGQKTPVMHHRSTKVGEELAKMMKKVYPAARKAAIDDEGNIFEPNERWLLQVMLQSNDIAVASLTQCKFLGPGRTSYWPNYCLPVGLAKVDIEGDMPSSAYRKLMEGFECMRIMPSNSAVVVDLGACPGGWTSVMRRLGCSVVAVDRSALDPVLMSDDCVQFVKGDAFTFEPTMVEEGGDCWMISDIIAYPDRIIELLDKWCSGNLASYMIVTMKFQGEEPALDELDKAVKIVESHAYDCRVKHFFNNKNEVTFMVSEKRNDLKGKALDLPLGILGTPMYPITLGGLN
eukprot:scaffold189_cov244-Chaetoceros_neogracile.AAC.14